MNTYYALVDKRYDLKQDLARKRKEKEAEIERIEEAAKKLKKS